RARRPGAGAPFLERVPLAAAALFAASVPFLVAGYAGILGVGDNNDMSAHLTAAWWLDARGPVRPMGALGDSIIGEGYPLGPHALVAALSRGLGISLVHAFDALTIVVPVLTAVAALGALGPRVPRLVRWTAAMLIGLTYLGASYLAQDAFKETMLGMLLVAFALALRDLLREGRAGAGSPRWWRGIPLGVIVAGAVYVYSAPGLAWPALTLGALVVLVAVRDRAIPLAALRAAIPATAAGLGALVVVAGPEAHHVWTFLHSSFAHEPKSNTGNLLGAIPAAQALGIWLQGDFRRSAVPYWPTVALDVIALVAFALALLRALRDRELVFPALLLAAGVLALESSIFRNIYNTAKSLAILAPAVALILMPWLATAWRRHDATARRVLWRLAGVVIVAGAAASTFLALREAPVGPQDHPRQVEALARLIQGRTVLYMNVDDFAQWELRGTRPATGPLLYAPRIVRPREDKDWHQREPLDFDNFASADLDRFDFVITPSSAYQSTPTANFHVVRRTRDFLLWRRDGATPERTPAEHDTGGAGAEVRCGLPLGDRIASAGGNAVLLPQPIALEQRDWIGQTPYPGDTAVARLQVPAGRWDVQLQYVSTTGLELRVHGLHAHLPGTLERLGSFWRAGSFTQRHSGIATIRVTADDPSRFGRLLVAQRRTRALSSVEGRPLGRLVLTPTGARPRTVPASSACGHYVDWYGPATARAARP
ncbi:MAG TPA: hypothetical protein VFT42_08490, partial [Solirubrobacteraceae bacterium]|nr:hypothetical protein [Solirubrobacteraceae bacterium]